MICMRRPYADRTRKISVCILAAQWRCSRRLASPLNVVIPRSKQNHSECRELIYVCGVCSITSNGCCVLRQDQYSDGTALRTGSVSSTVHWRGSSGYTEQRQPEAVRVQLLQRLATSVLLVVVWPLHPVLAYMESTGRRREGYVDLDRLPVIYVTLFEEEHWIDTYTNALTPGTQVFPMMSIDWGHLGWSPLLWRWYPMVSFHICYSTPIVYTSPRSLYNGTIMLMSIDVVLSWWMFQNYGNCHDPFP